MLSPLPCENAGMNEGPRDAYKRLLLSAFVLLFLCAALLAALVVVLVWVRSTH
jgi:hypothetical protein